ncbi:MAG: hypothetical protein ISN29_07485 [Gammaproteobacteria bacterium AqS3]|nr:hypothetical protein [Gammaproteobacteria bacterium AqS3]
MIRLEIIGKPGYAKHRKVYVQTMEQAKEVQARCFRNGETCAIYEGNI